MSAGGGSVATPQGSAVSAGVGLDGEVELPTRNSELLGDGFEGARRCTGREIREPPRACLGAVRDEELSSPGADSGVEYKVAVELTQEARRSRNGTVVGLEIRQH